MAFKKEYEGTTVYSAVLNRNIDVTAENEELLRSAASFVFEEVKQSKPAKGDKDSQGAE